MPNSDETVLRQRREAAGKSVEWLGRKLGVSPEVVRGWETDKIAISPALRQRALDSLDAPKRKPSTAKPAPSAIQDPLLRDIVDALDRHIDHQKFELSMVELLRDDHPTLVPVMGGADGGSDGVTAVDEGKPPIHLISTTSKNPVANFQENVDSLRKNHPDVGHVLFACSKPLTPHMRRKLKMSADKVGVTLDQAYHQVALATRLLDRPDIASDLLNVTCAPRTLTQAAASDPAGLEAPGALGRVAELEWLIQQTDDCLVVGETGMGKAALLSAVAQRGEALFLDGADRTQTAHDVRRDKPLAIMVPNANTDDGVAAVQILQSIRKQPGVTFRIIASSVPGKPASRVRRILNLPRAAVRALPPMDADDVASLVKQLSRGRLPDDVVSVIRRQAHGKPGLAAQLTQKCFVGDGCEAATGEALCDLLTENLDEESLDLLAVLSLGGAYGMTPKTAIAAVRMIGKATSDLHQALQAAQAQGVVDSAGTRPAHTLSEAMAPPEDQRHAVAPYDLRCWMIRRAMPYWSSTGTLVQLMGLFKPESREAQDAVRTLIGAAMRKADIPNLSEWVRQQKDARLIWDYAHVNRHAAVWACRQYPKLMGKLAEPLLENAPDIAVSLLLDHLASEAGAKERQDMANLSPKQDTVLYHVRRWTSGGEAARMRELLSVQLQRRRQVVADVTHWLDRQEGDAAEAQIPALAFMCVALSPAFEFEGADPGQGTHFTIRYGILFSDELRAVADLWPRLLSSLQYCPDRFDVWEMLTSLVWDWMAPRRCGHVAPNADQKSAARAVATTMLQDLVHLSRSMQGVQLRLKRMAEYIGLDLDITDPSVLDLQVLDPAYQKKKGDSDEDLDAWVKESYAAARKLGEEWGRRGAADMVRRLDDALREIRYSKTPRSFIDVIPVLCEGAASVLGDECIQAVELLIDKNIWQHNADPFIRVCIKRRPAGWESALRLCLSSPAYAYSAIEAIMTDDDAAKSDLGDEAFDALINLPPMNHSAVEHLAVRNQLPERHLLAALRLGGNVGEAGSDARLRLSVGAAVGHWQAREMDESNPQVLDAWQSAIVQSAHLDVQPNDHALYWVGEILSKAGNGALALRWMREAMISSQQGVRGTRLSDTAAKAVKGMSKAERETLLDEAATIGITLGSYFCAMDWIPACIGDDPDLYARLLTHDSLADVHGHPLAGEFTQAWRQKALAALKKYDADEVAFWAEGGGGGVTWIGSFSEHSTQVREKFERLQQDKNELLQKVGAAGVRRLNERILAAQKREQDERKRGILDDE